VWRPRRKHGARVAVFTTAYGVAARDFVPPPRELRKSAKETNGGGGGGGIVSRVRAADIRYARTVLIRRFRVVSLCA